MNPEPLDPGFQVLIDGMAAAHANGAPEWHTMSPADIRAASADLRKSAIPVSGVTRREIAIHQDGVTLPARLYTPEGAPDIGPGLVYFHGGGFTIGSVDSHDSIVAKLAVASGVKILSVEYRLAPEHLFPTAHDDALMSARWVFDNADSVGFDRNRIALGGDSAGANLASSACLDIRQDRDRKIKFQLLFYPNTTIKDIPGSREVYAKGYYLTHAIAHHFFRQYVTGEQARNPRIDLLGRADLSGLPPTFFTVGHCDMLYDECLLYVEHMRAAGVSVELVTYPGYIHSFYGFGDFVPGVSKAFEQAGAALAAGLAAN